MVTEQNPKRRCSEACWLILVTACLTGCVHYQPRPLSPAETAAGFASRSVTNAQLQAFFETNHVELPGLGHAWNLKALTLLAFCYQPSLAEARTQLEAAQAARITAGQRPNPSIAVTPGYDSQIPGNPSPWLVTITTDWPIETAGKRKKRVAQSEHLAEAAQWNLVGTVWQVRSRVRAALVSLYAARETQSLLTRQVLAQSNVVSLLEGQLAAGSVSGFEVMQARVALQTAQLADEDAVGQYFLARGQLANALGMPLHVLDDIELSFESLDEFPRELTQPEVRTQALLNRSDVRGALAEYAASQSALQLEIAGQYPDVHLGPGYAWNAGSAADNQWNLGLSVSLPILNQNQGPIAESAAKRAQAAAHFLTVQANAVGEINAALTAYQSALKQLATAQALLRNLQRRLESTREQLRAGAADALALASAEVEFATGAQSQFAARIKAQQALGQLEDAVQSPLTLTSTLLHAGATGGQRSQ
ncbi:MAG TPA: TolC family protein [Verrucomicrobiae bacterium]|nr:TolC family protein [Verrucomicrobiae bacterium]